jgi:hypothetical protein
LINAIEHPVSRLSNAPCVVCGRDTLHRGMQCLVCGTDFQVATPTVPFRYGGKAGKPKQSPPVRDSADASIDRREARAELWMAKRLRVDLTGDTTREQRMAIIRSGIRTIGPTEPAGRNRGHDESWEVLFKRIFREPL